MEGIKSSGAAVVSWGLTSILLPDTLHTSCKYSQNAAVTKEPRSSQTVLEIKMQAGVEEITKALGYQGIIQRMTTVATNWRHQESIWSPVSQVSLSTAQALKA